MIKKIKKLIFFILKNKHFYACSVCGGKSFLRLYKIRHLFNICRCKDCGVICLNPRMNEEGYEEYYRNYYFGNYFPKIETRKPYEEIKESSREVQIFSHLKEYVSHKSKIVEIGCGEGKNLIVFFKQGFSHLTGLEPSPDCCRRLQNFYDIECINKSLANFDGEKKFDCVILSHMLEHFIEPDKALKKIRNMIKPHGIVYIRVPPLLKNNLAQFTIPHTFYFEEKTLKMLLDKSGFMIERSFDSPENEIVLITKLR